jgi:hypothetical protein
MPRRNLDPNADRGCPAACLRFWRRKEMYMAIARFESVDIDCPNDVELRGFYQPLTGLEADPLGDVFPSLRDPRGFWIRFQQVGDYAPPTWPSRQRGKQVHLDFHVRDLDAGVQRALALGASMAPEQPGEGWRVMLDPAGHPFCLTTG